MATSKSLSSVPGSIPFDIPRSILQFMEKYRDDAECTTSEILLAALWTTQHRLTGIEDCRIDIVDESASISFDSGNLQVRQLCVTVGQQSFQELVQAAKTALGTTIRTSNGSKRDMGAAPLRLVFNRSPLLANGRPLAERKLPKSDMLCAQEIPEIHVFEYDSTINGYIVGSAVGTCQIENTISACIEVLKRGLLEPDKAVKVLPLRNECSLIHEHGVVTGYSRDASVIEAFRHVAEKWPTRTAILDAFSQWTYETLDQKSDVIACWIRNHHARTGNLVAVIAGRSCQTVAAFLGIMKANMAYVPLDQRLPAKRLEAILSSMPDQKLVLLGPGVEPQQSFATNKENVKSIDDILDGVHSPTVISEAPNASGLAYIIFTSGSTGQPKGVMVEHRGILRLVAGMEAVTPMPDPDAAVAHMASIAFDASTFEIYTALISGRPLVCIDDATVFDLAKLGRTFHHHNVRQAFIPTALLKQCLTDHAYILSELHTVYAGGERMDPEDAQKAARIVPRIFNVYGPTENTVFSTMCRLNPEDDYHDGVPIGKPLPHNSAYVMDSMHQLLPTGAIGELVLAGDGVARGYTDPTRDVGRFIDIFVDGQTTKAYCTGDNVRYRSTDHQLEFLGRVDHQVKIRGFRVELQEVDRALSNSILVQQAVTLARKTASGDQHLVGFVTLAKAASSQANGAIETKLEKEDDQVQAWKSLYDNSTWASLDDISHETLGRDFTGWASMYDGSLIDRAEMNEWLDDTIGAISNGNPPAHVLEIGAGTGMILFNLLDNLQSYVGLDSSEASVEFLQRRSQSLPGVADRVRLYPKTATDLRDMAPEHLPPLPYTVVINSVVQYFPSEDYLRRTIEDVLHAGGADRLYIGDLRSYALYREFCASRVAYKHNGNISKRDFGKHVADFEEAEEELLVDPAFFTQLATSLKTLIRHVEILPKCMKATNELSAYRYAAVIHTTRTNQAIHSIPAKLWWDFTKHYETGENLRRAVSASVRATGKAFLALSNIPHSKTAEARHILAALDDPLEVRDWLHDAREASSQEECLSTFDLHEIAREAGCKVEVSWSRQFSQRGGLDAVFHTIDADDQFHRTLFNFPQDDASQPPRQLTSQPVRGDGPDLQIERQLREALRAQLPEYMTPTLIEVLEHFPMSHTGKIDRKALESNADSLLSQRASSREIVIPQTDLERTLCEEFAAVLGFDAVSLRDSFLDLGGHSLMAMRVASRVNKRLDRDVLTVGNILSHPIIEDLAKSLETQPENALNGHLTTIPRLECEGPADASYAQSRLWFLDQLYPGSAGYIVPLAVRVQGNLHVEALHAALSAIERRHESLRTVFATNAAGEPMQVVRPFSPSSLRIVELEESDATIQKLLDEEEARPFDLQNEAGWRVTLYRTNDHDHVLSVIMHHIICDGWSVDILCHELDDFYSAALKGKDPLSIRRPLPVQYRDYATWEKNPGAYEVRKQQLQLDYWKKQLQGSQAAELPVDKPRPELLVGKAGTEEVTITGSLYHDLQDFSVKHQVTTYNVLLAAFRATLFRMSGSEDSNIGIANANRSRSEVEELIGFFVNLQCIRIPIPQDETFGSLIQTTRSIVADAHEHRDVPFERIVAAIGLDQRDASRNPLVQLTFVLHSQEHFGQISLEGLRVDETFITSATRFDLEFHLFHGIDRLQGYVLFSTHLYYPETIRNMISVFMEVLRQGMQDPIMPLRSLPLDGASSSVILSSDAPPLDESSIVDILNKQVVAFPDRIAVKDHNSKITYSQLHDESNTIARWLLSKRLPAESVIGVLAKRSCETVIIFIGILKAGLAYLPMDSNVPWERIKTVLDTVPKSSRYLFLGSGVRDPNEAPQGITYLRVGDILKDAAAFQPNCVLSKNSRPTASSLAYVIYTSGSTGEPKGIMIEHKGIVRLAGSVPQLKQGGVTAHIASLSFDMSSWEIYTAILNGGTVMCIENSLDLLQLAETFAAESVRTGMFTPVWIKECLATCPQIFNTMDLVFMGGEPLDPQDTRRVLQLVDGLVYNAYGPTEGTVISTLYPLAKDGSNFGESISIGEPISNTGALVIDFAQQHLVPPGVIGELLLTGDGLARGYTNVELTARGFIEVTLEDGTAARAYRTGDAVRVRAKDKQIVILGRIDNQVKVRGYRVELEEVEKVLRTCEEVHDAAALIYQTDDGESELVAFVAPVHDVPSLPNGNGSFHTSPEKDTADMESALYSTLSHRLPPFMIPTMIRVIDKLPTTSSGKIDRQTLARRMRTSPPTTQTKQVPHHHVSPRDSLEQALCEEFGSLLRTSASIGITDDFFRLGGHSIMAVRLTSRIKKRLGLSLAVRDIFDQPVVEDLAAIIRPRLSKVPTYAPIPKASAAGPAELSYAQSRLWFLEQLSPGSVIYVMPVVFRLLGSLSVEALEAALNAVHARHDVLRTTITEHNGKVLTHVHPHDHRTLSPVLVDSEAALENMLYQDRRTPFNLQSQPPYRVTLYRLAEQNHVLSIVMHHIISDGWSLDIMRRELATYYTAHIDGSDLFSVLPPLSIQYRDFSLWQKQHETAAMQQRQIKYWTEHLEGSRAAELFTDRPRPSTALSGDAGVEEFWIEGSTYRDLQAYCSSVQTTPFIVLLTVFRIAHYRITGMQDAIIGTANANRNREELEQLIGFFVNLQALRIKISDDDDNGGETFQSLLQQVRNVVLSAQANQDVPFEKIVAALGIEKREVSRDPLVQLTFTLHALSSLQDLPLKGIQSLPMTKAETTRFDLEFHLFQEKDNAFRGWVPYATDLFEPATVRNLVEIFLDVLVAVLQTPTQRILQLPLNCVVKPSSERLQLGPTVDEPKQSIIDVFQAQVRAHPERRAVKDQSLDLTYAQLDAQSDLLAAWLKRYGNSQESWVGVLSGRSCQTIVAFLGILKANLAYLPLDEGLPDARIESLISSMPGERLVLAGPGVSPSRIKMDLCTVVSIDEALQQQANHAIGLDRQWSSPSTASSLAYVMFTSGSTGKPKGVMINHIGIVRMAAVVSDILPTNPHSTSAAAAAHMASISFDMSTWEIYTALLNGYSLICIDRATLLDSQELTEVFSNPTSPMRMATFTPVLLKHSLAGSSAMFHTLRALFVAGDVLDPRTANDAMMHIHPQGAMFNAYGPTENSVISTIYQLQPGREDDYVNGVPIGRAVRNTGAWVVDGQQRILRAGVIGELVVTGDGLARGYTDSRFDEASFVTMDIGGVTTRAYRTGDLARYRPKDSQLEFLGRKNNTQVKVRGYRVELPEVERTLLDCDEVNEAAAMVCSSDGSPELIGFVVLAGARSGTPVQVDKQAIFDRLRARLPHYMVPSRLEILDSLPVNDSGKVDRRELLRIAEIDSNTPIDGASTREIVAAKNATEQAICEEFQKVLGVEEMGVTDDFFRLGGHSEMAVRLISRIRKRLTEAKVTVADLFNGPSVEQLAKRIQTRLHDRSVDESSPFAHDLKALPAQLLTSLESGRQAEYPSRIFLTGATGYFGSAILHALLRQQHVKKVIVLVRGTSMEAATDRIIRSATLAGWWSPDYLSRVEVWLGDLGKPNLGLQQEHWDRLSGAARLRAKCIDAIVHNGARVDWYSGYDSLRTANVISTIQLLELVDVNPFLCGFVFVSTGQPIDIAMHTAGGEDFYSVLARSNGYVQSKLIAEYTVLKICSAARRFPAHRVSIMKPGFIAGNKETGVANTDDYIWRVVAACVSIGKFPQDAEGSRVQISSCDDLASNVMKCVNGEANNSSGPDIVRAGSLPTWKFWQAVNAAEPGLNLVAESPETWKADVQTQIIDRELEHPIRAVWPFVIGGHDGVLGERVDNTPENGLSRAIESYDEDLQAVVTANMQYLEKQEYFTGQWSGQKEGVFRRNVRS